MSAAEARVLIARLLAVVEDLRDLSDEAPPHVTADRGRHIDCLFETIAELRRSYGVSM